MSAVNRFSVCPFPSEFREQPRSCSSRVKRRSCHLALSVRAANVAGFRIFSPLISVSATGCSDGERRARRDAQEGRGRLERVRFEKPLNIPDLSGTNLSGTNLTGANLTEANLSGANFSGTNFSGTILPVLQ